MNTFFKSAFAVAGVMIASQALAQVTFYEADGFRGRTFATDRPVRDFSRFGFNDRASSVIVEGDRRWEACSGAGFSGQCVVLRPGSYDSLRRMGLNDQISSVRPVGGRKYYANEAPPPPPTPAYEYRRRPDERTFEARVTSVHAVMGPPEQRCWVERQEVNAPSRPNVGGAVAGALIGGILGHQIGSGRGQDVATVGGAVVGGTVGANVGRDQGGTYTQDVQRCQTVASNAPPSYWDVTYDFNGQMHRVQMSSPPGDTVLVNGEGVPRG